MLSIEIYMGLFSYLTLDSGFSFQFKYTDSKLKTLVMNWQHCEGCDNDTINRSPTLHCNLLLCAINSWFPAGGLVMLDY